MGQRGPRTTPPSALPLRRRIDQVEICGDPDKIADWLATPLDQHVNVQWMQDEDPGLVAVQFTHSARPRADRLVRID